MKILTFDPSMKNWGYCLAEQKPDGTITILDAGVLRTKSYKESAFKADSKAQYDLYRIGVLLDQIVPLIRQCDMIVAELPTGSQSAVSMKGYAFVVALLAVCKKMQPCFVTVTPREVKVTFTGNPEASKQDMIQEAVKRFPDMPWPRKKKHGEMLIVEGVAEHIADAAAVLSLAIESQLNPCKGKNP